MSQRQAQFMQMMKILSDISQGNEDLRLKSEQNKRAEKMFIQQATEAGDKRFADALKSIVDAAPKLRPAMEAVLGADSGFSDQQKQAFHAYVTGAPISQVMQATIDANVGHEDIAKNDPTRMQGMQHEAALLASTGQNSAQYAQNQVQAAALGQGNPQAMQEMYTKPVADYMQMGAAIRALTGQTPFAYQTDQASSAAGYAQNAAQMQNQGVLMGPDSPIAGARVAPGTALQYDLGRGGNAAQFQRNNIDMMSAAAQSTAQMMAANAKGGLTSDDRIRVLGNMLGSIDKMENSKATETERQMAIALWNMNAAIGQFPQLHISNPKDAAGKIGLFKRMFGADAASPNFGAPAQQQPQSSAPPATNPINYFAPPQGGMNTMPPAGFNPWGRPQL